MKHRWNRFTLLPVLAWLCSLALVLLPAQPALALDLIVDTALDVTDGSCSDGSCSLRDAIQAAAASGDSIYFAGDYTITLTLGQLTIAKSVTIDGTGRNVTISGGGGSRVFEVTSGTVVLRRLTITNGNAGAGRGGGLSNNGGTVTVDSCLVSNNQADRGGGISNQGGGSLTIVNSTISGNTSIIAGAGIFNNSATVTIERSLVATNTVDSGSGSGTGGGLQNNDGSTGNVINSTFYGNQALGGSDDGGGAIMVYGGTVNLTNCTLAGNHTTSTGRGGGGISHNNNGTVNLSNMLIANNTSDGGGPDIYGQVVSGDYNLIETTSGAAISGSTSNNIYGEDPRLSVLGSWGGDTQTMGLLPGSPVIDAANGSTCAVDPVDNVDQRNVARTVGSSCDIGAFESQGFWVSITGGSSQSTVINTAFANPLRVQANSAFGEPVGPDGELTFAGPGTGASTTPASQSAPTTDSTGKSEVSVTANGTTGSYSVTVSAAGVITPALFSLTNLPTNQPPTASGSTVGTNEDIDYAFVLADLGYADPESDPFDHLRVVALPADGTLYLDADGDNRVDAGEALQVDDLVSAADIAAGRYKFEPAADENGTPYTSFRFRVHDGTSESIADSTITIDVTAVNDRPSFTAGGPVTVLEDSGSYPGGVGWATNISAGPADELQQTLSFTLTNGNSALFAVQPAVDTSSGDLTFTPAANASGTALITLYLNDGGGTANGGQNISAPQVFTITVTAVNDPPTISNIADQQVNEGSVLGPVAFTVGDIDTPLSSLALSGTSSDPALVPVSAIVFGSTGANRTLTITPTPGMTGTVTITVTVGDGSDSDSDSFVLTVDEVTTRYVYLPLVVKNLVYAPDLVVDSVSLVQGGVQVVISNIGSAPVVNEFWVDLYVAPDTVPTAVNQTWQLLGSHGAAWGVTAQALPLDPGQSLVLDLSSPYLSTDDTDLGVMAPGTVLYAQVDSAAVGSAYGGVLEAHEMNGGAYNNVASSMAPTGFSGPIWDLAPAGPALSPRLPRRP